MPSYMRGSRGPEVKQLQTKLQQLRYYTGPIDGDFGGGTESAVKAFQRASALVVDGCVGAATWSKLMGEGQPLALPAIAQAPLAERCLALTGTFETSSAPPDCFAGLSGNFDGQGISLGVCQWNLGQGSLQVLLKDMVDKNAAIVDGIFHDYAAEFRKMLAASREEQLEWANSIQNQRHQIGEPWLGLLRTLARSEQFQAIQVEHAGHLLQTARQLCAKFKVTSQRALALMFDIAVQNGSINEIVTGTIERDFAKIPATIDRDGGEVARLVSIANRRAEAASRQWVEDVRTRKLTIANGLGDVHGRHYDLAQQYGITLEPFA